MRANAVAWLAGAIYMLLTKRGDWEPWMRLCLGLSGAWLIGARIVDAIKERKP